MPRLTEYLLKLATDSDELVKYRAIRDGHDKSTDFKTYLIGCGLNEEHVEALRNIDSCSILRHVREELEDESSNPDNPHFGISITFTCELNRITKHPGQ
jgi:hypothetical protein